MSASIVVLDLKEEIDLRHLDRVRGRTGKCKAVDVIITARSIGNMALV